jgi:hypothetical protein
MEYPYAMSAQMKAIVHYANQFGAKMEDTTFQKMLNDLVRAEFLHLFLDPVGEKYPLTELMQNFRGLNLSAFSFGASVAFGVCNAFARVMPEYGYEQTKVKAAIANIAVITMGCCENYDTLIHKPYCINIVNAGDTIIHGYSDNFIKIAEQLGVNTDFMHLPVNETWKVRNLSTEIRNKLRENNGIVFVPVDGQLIVLSMIDENAKLLNDKNRPIIIGDGHNAEIYLAGIFNQIYRAAATIISANAVRNTKPIISNIVVDGQDNVISCDSRRPEYQPLPALELLPDLMLENMKMQQQVEAIRASIQR